MASTTLLQEARERKLALAAIADVTLVDRWWCLLFVPINDQMVFDIYLKLYF